MKASGAAEVTLCDSSVLGSVDVSGSTGPVQIGGAECAAIQVAGTVKLTNNTGGVSVSGNTVVGSLSCSGNNPPPTNAGTPNNVSGARKDQCATL